MAFGRNPFANPSAGKAPEKPLKKTQPAVSNRLELIGVVGKPDNLHAFISWRGKTVAAKVGGTYPFGKVITVADDSVVVERNGVQQTLQASPLPRILLQR